MNSLIDLIDERCVAGARRIAFVGVLGMLGIALLTVADVMLRWLANESLPGFNEVLEMGIAVAIAATFPAGAAQRVNLNIDLLGEKLGDHWMARLKVFGAASMLVMYVLLAWQVALHAQELTARNAETVILGVPQAPFIWAISGLFALCSVFQLIAFIVTLRDSLATGVAGSLKVGGQKLAIWGIFLLVLTLFVLFAFNESLGFLSTPAQAYPGTVAVGFFGVMWILALLLVPLGAVMALVGVAGAALLGGMEPALSVLGTSATEFLTNGQLAVLPLFLMMGSFAAAAGLSTDIYELAHTLFGHRRGGLALATIGGCAGFGALTGSSLATAATIGNVALPEMRARGYAPGLATGCVAAGGTLGQLVPPSTVIVLYAILTEESIGQLFIGAIIPAIIAVILYMITITLYVRFQPDAAPPALERKSLREILLAFRRAWGVLLLFGLVIGGLYGGIFTATEAAAVGAGSAFLFALARGKLSGGALLQVMGETTATTAMIYILIFGAVTFSFFMGISGLPELLTSFIGGLDMSPLGVIALLLVIYIILGAIMDPFPVMVITVPIITPLITGMGYDLVWWGIIMVCVVETGLITPPFGINVFILKGIAGGDVPTATVFKGVMPFVAADLIKLAILVLFPALILWLPSTMIN